MRYYRRSFAAFGLIVLSSGLPPRGQQPNPPTPEAPQSKAAAPPADANDGRTPPASRAETTPPVDKSPVVLPGSRIVWNLPYVEGGDEKQKLDLYAPPDVHDAPTLIFVHGGEWMKGDKTEVSFKPKFLNENGVIFVSINYRLSGTHKHPAQVDDVAAAVRWAREHVATYGGDPRKIFLMGHSAGCHLVTLTSLDPRVLETVGLKPSDLAGVVSWSGGAFDLVEKVKGGGLYADCIHANFGDDEAVWRDASPLAHVADAKALPPFLFASAENHKPASRAASERIAARIREAGGNADTVLLVGKDHTAANHELGMLGDNTGATLLRFIREATATNPVRTDG